MITATGPRGVAILGMEAGDTRSAAEDFITNRHVTCPLIVDPSVRSPAALGKGYPTRVVPTTLIVDRHHSVVAVCLKALLADDLQPAFERIADGARVMWSCGAALGHPSRNQPARRSARCGVSDDPSRLSAFVTAGSGQAQTVRSPPGGRQVCASALA